MRFIWTRRLQTIAPRGYSPVAGAIVVVDSLIGVVVGDDQVSRYLDPTGRDRGRHAITHRCEEWNSVPAVDWAMIVRLPTCIGQQAVPDGQIPAGAIVHVDCSAGQVVRDHPLDRRAA
jgi:hypothetical protein